MLPAEKIIFDSQEIKVWTLSIPFRSPLIKEAKALNGRWNSADKVWIVECKECELVWVGLDCKIVNSKVKEAIIGNFGTGCITTAAKAARYGYDAIEK